jgi:RNA polymerase sigma-70 factor (ECF subfamily)
MTEHGVSPREGDAEAIELTLAGDRNAYRVLVERHSASVFRLACRLTGNRHDAEEVVQEGFLRAYQKLEQFEKRANFGTWVYRIAANYAIDRMRQKRSEEARREEPSGRTPPENEVLDRVPDKGLSPERLVQNTELRKQLESALETLTPAERTAFVMRHWHGCGIEEIAAALDGTAGAAKNTVFRAMQKLRNVLAPLVHQVADGTPGVRAAGAQAMGTEP